MIIVLVGQSKSGKDTVADFLCAERGMAKIAFADPLKRICRDTYGFTIEQLWGPSELRNVPDRRYVRLTAEQCEPFDDLISLWHNENEGVESPVPVYDYLGLTKEEYFDWVETGVVHLAPRFALQRLGTEWGRDCYADTWADKGFEVATEILEKGYGYTPWNGLNHLGWEGDYVPTGVVISDGRFLNEVQAARRHDVTVVRIDRDLAGLGGAAGKHRSETEQKEIPEELFTHIIDNNSDLRVLHMRTLQMHDRVTGRVIPYNDEEADIPPMLREKK
jgi:hypothetical protein